MKIIPIILATLIASSYTIKLEPPKRVNSLDPNTVKSTGSFSNQAPEATKIINPDIARPKAEIKLNINGQAILQKTVNAGTIEKSEVGKAYDYNTHEWHDEPILAKEKVEVQSTKLVNTENTHYVNIDLLSGKYIPPPKFTPKLEFGGVDEKPKNKSPDLSEAKKTDAQKKEGKAKVEEKKPTPAQADAKKETPAPTDAKKDTPAQIQPKARKEA